METLTIIRASLLLGAVTLMDCATHATQTHRVFSVNSHTNAALPLRLDPLRDDDGDGRLNGVDQCPNDPEDIDDFADADGCPEEDNDHDQIADALDACPTAAEDMDGFEDADGCPDLDNDGDGIADADDHSAEGVDCRNDPELFNGVNDEDGCPDAGHLELLAGCPVYVDGNVYFQRNSTVIETLSVSAVESMVAVIRANASFVEIGLVGYAERGERHALDLARRRAETVRGMMVRLGVAEHRLTVRWTTLLRRRTQWDARPGTMRSVRPIAVQMNDRTYHQWNGTRYVYVPENSDVPTAGTVAPTAAVVHRQ